MTESTTNSSGSADWRLWYEALRTRIDAAISDRLKVLQSEIGSHSRLGQAVQYSLTLPGKRFRPILTLECCRICGGHEELAMPAAIAVECIHTFSLIHDDLPALDNDELRRGQPCSHKAFGEGQALLAGDWLAAYALRLPIMEYPTELAAALSRTLAQAELDMIAGQAADVDGENRATDPELVEYIHRHKTARLIEAACRMGGLCAKASEEQLTALERFGRHLGLAFQITDDLLDVTGSCNAVGKHVGKDIAAAKQTYPATFGVEQSRVRARRETAAALEALEPFGPHAEHLGALAEYVVVRDR